MFLLILFLFIVFVLILLLSIIFLLLLFLTLMFINHICVTLSFSNLIFQSFSFLSILFDFSFLIFMSEPRARPVSNAAAEVAVSTAVAAAVAVKINRGCDKKAISVTLWFLRPPANELLLRRWATWGYPHLLGPHGQRGQ